MTAMVFTVMPIISSMPLRSAARPDTAVPKRTSARPVTLPSADHATCTIVLSGDTCCTPQLETCHGLGVDGEGVVDATAGREGTPGREQRRFDDVLERRGPGGSCRRPRHDRRATSGSHGRAGPSRHGGCRPIVMLAP